MAFNKYFQDELNALRELGSAFSQQNPGLAKFLSEDSEDPDVERLLEGFAFISGRLRQKLDDEFPEISHSLINLLWPNYLRPTPSMSILEFTPRAQAITEKKTIPRGTEVQSVEVEGTACRFQTCYDVDVAPIEIKSATAKDTSDGAYIKIGFDIEPGVSSEDINLDTLRLHLHEDQKRPVSRILYMWLFRYLRDVEVSIKVKGENAAKKTTLPAYAVKPTGFAADQSLLPNPAKTYSGYRLLQEYFQLGEKFLFFDVHSLGDILKEPKLESFSLTFRFMRQFDNQIKVRKENFRLFCTPIVNLYEQDADPIRLEHLRSEYLVRPSTDNLEHVEVFSVEQVTGKLKGRSTQINYAPYESFEHTKHYDSEGGAFYKLNYRPSVLNEGLDHYISFVTGSQNEEFHNETISVELVCTNRNLPGSLQAGQINCDTGNSPEYVTFNNISRVTSAMSPPFVSGLHWRLLANLALHYRSIVTVEGIRSLVRIYDFAAFTNRQRERATKLLCEGIENVETKNIDVVHAGRPTMGLETTLYLRESKFGAKGLQGEANMYLFASVLNLFFAQYARTNSFHQLKIKALESGEIYSWPMSSGSRERF
ncbi:type VI secretion system baseplate subunit TssF [Aestuariibacter salexigens]|uniref:type VI secretion system baseplate subunit TssF n=1 Tax=Aestuariibacter salexigens TaxID=226010 RepID=UPI0004050BFB|nr:type VI secretion system baseplate subunit TssF [Aestuariibacter salexigens]